MSTNGLKPAAAYLRKSSPGEDRQAASIEQQRREVTLRASEDGCTMARWFEDARSGTTAGHRDAFLAMIAEAQRPDRPWQVLYCYDTSRFSRGGPDEAGYYRHLLRQAGVEVRYVAETIPEGMGGEILLPIKDALNKDYSVKLSGNVLRGCLHYAREGDTLGRIAPFGYDRARIEGDDVRLVERWSRQGERAIVFEAPGFLQRLATMDPGAQRTLRRRLVPSAPDRVATVKRMFALAAAGQGLSAITRTLNAERRPSPQGDGWCAQSVGNLLRNPVYTGVLAWGARLHGRFHGVMGGEKIALPATARPHRDADYGHAVKVEHAHEPLVSESEWQVAQAILRVGNRPAPRGRGQTSPHVLSGLCRCTCGRSMCGAVQCRGTLRYYRCPKEHGVGGAPCAARMANADRLEAAVLDGVGAYLTDAFAGVFQGANFAKLVREAARDEAAARRPARRSAATPDYRRRIETLARRIADHPDLADVLVPQLQRLKAEAAAAETRARKPIPQLDAERLARAALAYRDRMAEAIRTGPVEDRKVALRQILREAQVDTHTGEVMLVLEPYAGCQPVAESLSRLAEVEQDAVPRPLELVGDRRLPPGESREQGGDVG